MRPATPILAALLLALVLGAVVAVVARAGLRRDPRDDELVNVPLDRIQHTITLPPDHNARITAYVDPILHLRRRNEVEIKRRIEFNRPKLQDSLNATLSRFHVTNLGAGDAKQQLAREIRDNVNAILGGDYVEAVSAQMTTSR